MVFQQRYCCPLLILQTSTMTMTKEEKKKKHNRKKLNGSCPLQHNDKLWYDIKMPPSLLQKFDQANLQLRQRDLSSRIFLPTHTQLVCSTAPVQCWHQPDGIESKGKRWHNTDLAVLLSTSSSSLSSSSVRGIYTPTSSDFSGTKCLAAEKTYKL